ncbi:polysaccharide deacetylase family protein [Chryseobacterium salivictor]|uniref:NodB homology domain-containing protein n=1 Tax=Chryseobacterium salivictor TaxID=2547600 RepID=A0A4P6ZHE0_9FLAO|nr:polysaccharide deacetylase family protein [Chryseobacterium salivictor]QBO59151.1 hypothetical protein NBC122_02346 [Chryseobacterium salivictor]
MDKEVRMKFRNRMKKAAKFLPMETCFKMSPHKMILPYYHTVTDSPKPHYSNLGYFRDKNDFIRDLDFFQNNFQSVGIENLDFSRKTFHLSFDDGLAENYSIVAQLLYEQKVHATFFVNSNFIDNKEMFIRHKVSLIMSEAKKSPSCRTLLSGYLKTEEKNIDSVLLMENNENTVNKLGSLLLLNFEDYLKAQKPYLTTHNLKEMAKMGFTIGNHSTRHFRFSSLKFAEQKKDIFEANSFLKELNIEYLYFCFPYGDDLVPNELFDWMYLEADILKSFGTSGLKRDGHKNHYHRILMEDQKWKAEEIIKFEYLYYFMKRFFNKNKTRR